MIAFHGDPATIEAVPLHARSATFVRGGTRYRVRLAMQPLPAIEPGLIDNPSEVSAALDAYPPRRAADHARYILEWDDSHCCLAVHAFAWRDGDAKVRLAIGDAAANVPVGNDVVLRLDLPGGAYARVRAHRSADGRFALRLERFVARQAAR